MGRTTGSGQGSIYKRGDKWRGQITINGQRLSHTAKKKSEVIDWIAQMRTDPSQITERSNITVEELAKEWLKKEKKPVVTEQVYYGYETVFDKHLYPYLGKYKVQDLNRDTIEEFYQKSYGENYAKGTVNNFAIRFKELLNYAIDQNIIAKNPHDKVILPKTKGPEKIDAYTREQQKIIIDHVKNKRDSYHTLIYILLATGMRVGEACALTWDDINFEERSININKTIVRLKGGAYSQPHPKTASSNRTIYVSVSIAKVLMHFRRRANENYVFVNERKSFYTAYSLRSRWIRTCAELNIPYKGLHALRHTFATRALEEGIDVKTLSNILGHKSVVTTMNIYQDVFSEQKKKVADIMDSYLK